MSATHSLSMCNCKQFRDYPLTVHNIVKTYCKSREILCSANERQDQKTKTNGHDLWPLTSAYFELFLKGTALKSLWPKEEKDHPDFFLTKWRSHRLWWCGGELVPMASGVACLSVKAPLMLSGTYRFGNNICFHSDDVWLIVATQRRAMLCRVKTTWLRSKRVCVLDLPVCSPDPSVVANVLHIMNTNYRSKETLDCHPS